jgi:PAS domain S-box-containing protein
MATNRHLSQVSVAEMLPPEISQALLVQQPALQLIYDTAPIGLAFLSPDCRYLQINERLTEICGISVEDHLGRSVRDCVPALAEAVEAIVGSIMKTGEPVLGVEVAGQRADRTEERSWVTYWHPLRNPSGEIVGVNVAAEEVTERKRAEQAVRRARDAAETALHNLRETQKSLIEAEKLAALGRLVSGVAHEINNPVGTCLTVASALARRSELIAQEMGLGTLKRSSLSDFLGAVQQASAQLQDSLSRAAELIQSFKQVAADRNNSDLRSFDLGDLTEQVAGGLRPALPKKRVRLNVQCLANLAMSSYPGSYGQVLTNLFLNSIAHAFPDSREGTIDIKVRDAGAGHVEIIFADDGCGMSADVRKQAFDPFFTTRRHQGCTGLGLHIVYSVVTDRLGGRLDFGSEPGEGTVVRLILPRQAPDFAASDKAR